MGKRGARSTGASAKESVARAAIVLACSVLIALDFRMNVSFAGPPGTVLSSSQKVSFCLTDYAQVNSSLEHSATATYIPCEQTDPQGISVGWADVYDWDLEGQSLDITGLPDGDYWLVSTADPDNLLNE